jgi:HD-GYP domain-containing protein (c-di-GMP phosphodiesterase class II)
VTWTLSSVRTKVARRLLVLFVLCALAPLCAFTALASWMVATQVRQQVLHRLHVDAKAIGMGTVERLIQTEARLRFMADLLAADTPASHAAAVQHADRFEMVWLVDRANHATALKGQGTAPAVSAMVQTRLDEGNTAIVLQPAAYAQSTNLDLAVPLSAPYARGSYLIARVNALVLWDLDGDSSRPLDVDLCVFSPPRVLLACSEEGYSRMHAMHADLDAGSGTFTWRAQDEEMLGAYWSAPLAGQFQIPSWIFVVMQPDTALPSPTSEFRRAFTIVVVLTLALIVALSLHQIQHRLQPLERLEAAASRIRGGDFAARARVTSGDEFEALADSFNLMAVEVQRQFAELRALQLGTLEALARTVDAKSPWTAGHSQRVTAIGVLIGRAMGVPADGLEQLRHGGLLHDIGKLGVPGRILDKPGALTAEEWRTVRQHPERGARILEPIAAYAPIIPIVLEHHERFDGSGYPRGLVGEAISLGGRIFAVADVVDAMSSDRPYRPGLPIEDVVRYITDQAGRQFDPRVVEAFLRTTADIRAVYAATGAALASECPT